MQRTFAITVTAPALLLATASPALAGGGLPYPGDLGQAIATVVIFLLLLFVLGKWAWKPIIAQLQRREEDLNSKFEDAEKRQGKADEMAEEYQQHLDNIEGQTEDMIATAKRQAAKESQGIVAEARTDARQIMDRAAEQIESAKLTAQRQLQSQTAELAAEMAGAVLKKTLTDDDRQRLATEAAKQIAQAAESEESAS